MRKRFTWKTTAFILLTTSSLIVTAVVSAKQFGDWSAPVSMELTTPGASSDFNTPYNDGCPIQAPDGLSFYMASNRPGGLGGQDIWISSRKSTDDPWGSPVNAGAPVNSPQDDFCPSPIRGHGLFFVSRRPHADNCGNPTVANNSDIYFTRLDKDGWEEPQNVGCNINSAADEWSPSYFEGEDGQAYLYFASTRPGGYAAGGTDADIYFSVNFGPAQLAPGLNTAFDDHRPNVRKDGREIVFDSTRPGTLGGPDIWTATREDEYSDWDDPVHLPAPINSASAESRASLSWDGSQLVFGSNRAGVEGPAPGTTNLQADIFVATRERVRGPK
ncbi:MAG: hypothetical protein ACR2IH_14045 [Pyrinomonadaceae bacterium]